MKKKTVSEILFDAPDYQQLALYDGPAEEIPWQRSFPVTLPESDWEFIIKLLQDEIKQQKQLIAKTRKYPSDTIASSVTRERKQSIIDNCEALTNKILIEFT